MHTVRGRRVLIWRQNKNWSQKWGGTPMWARHVPRLLLSVPNRRRVEEFKLSETPGLLLWSEETLSNGEESESRCRHVGCPSFSLGQHGVTSGAQTRNPSQKKFLPTASGLEIWKLRKLVGWKTFSKSSELTCPWFEKLESLIGRPRVDTVSTPRSC